MTEFVLSSLVNSILNSDGTITVSSATGNVTLSLALGHINMWTAAQNNTASWNVYNVSTDDYPQVTLQAGGAGGGQVLLGIGGVTSPNVVMEYGGASGVLYVTTGNSSHSANLVVFGSAPGVGDSNAILTLYGITGTNFEYMTLDAIQQNAYVWNTASGGTGLNRPIIFESANIEVMRITTDPIVQLSVPLQFANVAMTPTAYPNIYSDTSGVLYMNPHAGQTIQMFNLHGNALNVNGAKIDGVATLTFPGALGPALDSPYIGFTQSTASALSVYTANAAGTAQVERMRWLGAAAQGAAGITIYEPTTINAPVTIPAPAQFNVDYISAHSYGAVIFESPIVPNTDSTLNVGSSILRFGYMSAVDYYVYTNAGDTYPAAQLNLNSLQFGPGGSSLADISLFRESAQILAVRTLIPNAGTVFDVLPNGSSTTSVLRVWSVDEQTHSALESLNIRSDTFSGAWEIGSRETGGGALRALVFASGGIEAFRMTTTPNLQMASSIYPASTNTYVIGNSSQQFDVMAAYYFASYGTAGDIYASAQMNPGSFSLGAGGSYPQDVYLTRGGTGTLLLEGSGTNANVQFSLATRGSDTVAAQIFFRTGYGSSAYEYLEIASDDPVATSWNIRAGQAGGLSVRPLVFSMQATPVLQINPTTPYIQWFESSTGTTGVNFTNSNSPATSLQPITWLKVKLPSGAVGWIPAWS